MPAFKPLPSMALLLALCLTLTSAGAAQWSGGLEGGTVMRDGESSTRIRARASLDSRPLSHDLHAEWYRRDTSSIELGYKPRYWLSEKLYTFGEGRLRFEEDLGIDRETQLLGGLGYQLLATREQQLLLEAGAGYRLTSFTEETLLEDAEEGVGVVRAAGSQILSDLIKLDLLADVFSSARYIQSQAELGVSLRVPQGAIRLSYRIRRVDIDELDAVEDSDTAVSFTVGF
ncbi:DUF481 domain-containing protein [Granulosicoccus sp. 3-233]|uniref:DUF481 domain-containing protein n=1 Tax=Granulosicoccus sp. 3-233 TaxID=3417969 RepID=UPI003D3474CB